MRQIHTTLLAGVLIVEPRVFEDERGFFFESWSERSFREAGLSATFVQDNQSRSRRGVLRGLHYQDMTAPLDKLVRCTLGEIFDVAVDLRVGSETFGRWIGVELTAYNRRQLFIPAGFAHGFVALSDVADVQYKQTGPYQSSAECTLAWNDPDVAISWPVGTPLLSPRDQQGGSLVEYLRNPVFAMESLL